MRLRKDAKVELLKRIPLFAGFGRRELEQIAQIADELDFEPGKELTREGAPGREFFVLAEGTADVVRGGETLRTLSDGDFFGEISLLTGLPRTATVTTTAPTRALVVTDRAFRQLLEDSPEIRDQVLAALGERLDATVP